MSEKLNIGITLYVLSLEDSVRDFEIMCSQLVKAGYELNIARVEKESEYTTLIRNNRYDIILADFNLPGFDAFGALRLRNEISPDVPFLCVSGTIGEETAVELLKLGAVDYVLKDRLEKLPLAIQRALNEAGEKKMRRKAEEELLRKEYILNETQQITKVGGWEYDVRSQISTFTEEVFHIYGVKFSSPDEGILFYHPDDRPLVAESFNKAITEGEPYTIEVRLINAQKENLWVRTAGKPIIKNGEIVRVIGNIMDITERKEAEEALIASEVRYRRLFEASKDGILILDADTGQVVDVNPFMIQMLGYSHQEFKGKAIWELGFLKDLIANRDNFQELQKQEYIRYEDLPLETIDGRTIHVEFVSNVYQVNHLRVIQCNIRDITERKLAEDALRLSEEKYRDMVEQINDVIFSTDVNGIFTYVSPTVEVLGGYKPDDMIGHSMGEFLDPLFLPLIKQQFQNVIEGKLAPAEYRVKTKSGELRWMRSSSKPIFIDNRPVGIRGVLTDISDRKKAEEELIKAKEKAEESDRLKTAFLHNISHEIRTPMNSIIGFSELLDEPGLLPETQKYFTNLISRSSIHLLSIINDIVNIATIEAGQEKINETEINLYCTLQLLYNQFIIQAKEQNIDLIFQSSSRELRIITDETKLVQIITNLISNALKFTKQGNIRFGFIPVETTHALSLQFFVEDTGIGISQEMHDLIFKRFHQVENTTTRHFGGSGLGLSITKAYVELLGGKIWVDSEVNKGSIFHFTIPVKLAT